MPNSLNLTKVQKIPYFAKGVPALSEGSSASKSGALGKLTKSQSTPENKGFQRLHSFVLQDQSAKLLPQERVCNCLKRRIDKNKNRTVMFNEAREKPTGAICNAVDLSGHAQFVLSRLLKKDVLRWGS